MTDMLKLYGRGPCSLCNLSKSWFLTNWGLDWKHFYYFWSNYNETVLFFGQVTWKGHPESFGVKTHLCSFTACFLGDEGSGAETVFNPSYQDLRSLNNVHNCFLNWAACRRVRGKSWISVLVSREELGNAWATRVPPSCFVIHWVISLLLVFLTLQPVKFVSSVL